MENLYTCKFQNESEQTRTILVVANSTNIQTKAPEIMKDLIQRGLVQPLGREWKFVEADPLFAYIENSTGGFNVYMPAVAVATHR